MKVVLVVAVVLAAVWMMQEGACLPVDQCSEVCALNFTLNCASNGRCLKAFSNSCDLDFYNCRYDENFKSVEVDYCRSTEAELCGEDDRYVVTAYL